MFLLDQNVPRPVRRRLRALGIPAVHASEIGLSRAPDEVVFERAQRRFAIVVTFDQDMADLAATHPRPHRGVIWIQGAHQRLTGEQVIAWVTAVVAGAWAHGLVGSGETLTVRRGRPPVTRRNPRRRRSRVA